MDLMEYQAKELFAKHDVPVSMGTVVEKPRTPGQQPRSSAARVVVKAQVKVGGRGKAGGVKLAESPDDAVAKADEILGMDIKGHTVHRVLIAPTADIAEEYYFSFLVDRAARQYLCIASTAGGVEIEVTAHENPDAVAKVGIDPLVGVDDAKAREIVDATGFGGDVADEAVQVIKKLWTAGGTGFGFHAIEFEVAEFGVGHEFAVDEQRAADAGAEAQYQHGAIHIARGAEVHLGKTCRVGVVDGDDLAFEFQRRPARRAAGRSRPWRHWRPCTRFRRRPHRGK